MLRKKNRKVIDQIKFVNIAELVPRPSLRA